MDSAVSAEAEGTDDASAADAAAGAPEQQCLTEDEARELLASIPEDLKNDCAAEISKTEAMLNDEGCLRARVESRATELESERLALQALIADPAWVAPPADTHADLLQALDKLGF